MRLHDHVYSAQKGNTMSTEATAFTSTTYTGIFKIKKKLLKVSES